MVQADIIDDLLSSDDDRIEEPRRAIAPNLSGKTNCKGRRRGLRRMPQATSVSAHLTRMATVSLDELCGVHIVDSQQTIGCACKY